MRKDDLCGVECPELVDSLVELLDVEIREHRWRQPPVGSCEVDAETLGGEQQPALRVPDRKVVG